MDQLEFETLAREAGWACNEVEEVGSGDFRQTFAELAYQMLLSMSRRTRMRARATAALGVLKAFTLGLPGGITARIDVEASKGTADTGDPERDLATLLVEVGQVAQAGGTGAVFFLDEMQGLDKVALAAVCMAMNRVGQRSLPVALVGAGLPQGTRLQSAPGAGRVHGSPVRGLRARAPSACESRRVGGLYLDASMKSRGCW